MKSNYIKLLSLFLLLVIVFSYTSPVFATTFENFDSYSDGALSGQGSWTGGSGPLVAGLVTQAGAKSVWRGSGGGEPTETVQSISPALTTDLTTFTSYIRSANANDGAGGSTEVRYYNGSTELFSTRLSQDTNAIKFDGASTVTVLGSISSNTWYQMEIEFNFTAHTARARVDGGTWTSSISDISSDSFTQVDKIALQFGGTTAAHYIDTMAYTIPAAAATGASTVIKRGSILTIKRGSVTTFRK